MKTILDDQRNRRRTLSNNTGAPEEDTDDYKINEEDNGLNNNAIDMELEIRRKMERTTVEVRNYPPVTEASPPSVTANILSTDPEDNLGLSILATPIPLPFTPDFPNVHDIDFGTRTTVSYASLSTLPSHIVQDHHIREVIQQPNVTELSAIPSSISASAPLALPIPLGKDEISFNHFDTQSGISALISDGHFRNSVSTDATTTNSVFEQRQLPEKIQVQTQISAREYEPVDDILGCTWDIVTNSCKDLFSLKLCSHCHDFGNIFLHNCKCLVKYTTAF